MTTRNRKTKIKRSEHSYPSLVITKYMGSKKAILPFVANELERLTEPGDIIIDLMAGTHTIGYALKNRCQFIANDIQKYSRVIGQTLLNHNPRPRFEGAVQNAFKRFFIANRRHLSSNFEAGLNAEAVALKPGSITSSNWEQYRDLCEEYPYCSSQVHNPSWPEEFRLLFSGHRIQAYKTLNKLEPYSLFSLYYANTYLGANQAADLDSLRFATDKLCDEWVGEHPEEEYDAFSLRCLLLSALIATLSRINPGPGHWAAFPRVNDRNWAYLIEQRNLDVYSIFISKAQEIENSIARNVSTYSHIVSTEDYVDFMKEVHEYIRKARLIYLDPPYSQGHYSRFYHLIETLVQYDYPDISHDGRYRTDRHQSPFAHKLKIGEAIGKICETARAAGTILVISYSLNGIIPNEEAFTAILRNFYPEENIEIKRLSSEHSKLGQAERMRTEEYLFTCRP